MKTSQRQWGAPFQCVSRWSWRVEGTALLTSFPHSCLVCAAGKYNLSSDTSHCQMAVNTVHCCGDGTINDKRQIFTHSQVLHRSLNPWLEHVSTKTALQALSASANCSVCKSRLLMAPSLFFVPLNQSSVSEGSSCWFFLSFSLALLPQCSAALQSSRDRSQMQSNAFIQKLRYPVLTR